MEDTASLAIEVEVQRLHWNIDPVHGKYSKLPRKKWLTSDFHL